MASTIDDEVSSHTPSQFHLKITAAFTRRRAAEESDGSPSYSTSCITFYPPLYERSDQLFPGPTSDEAANMLDAVHLLPQHVAATLVGQIRECCGRMALGAPASCGRILSLSVNVDLLVDELPEEDGYDDDGAGVDEEEELLGFGDATFCF